MRANGCHFAKDQLNDMILVEKRLDGCFNSNITHLNASSPIYIIKSEYKETSVSVASSVF